MTDEEILSLPAGLDLDGAIDDLVLGIDRRAITPALRTFAIGCSLRELKPNEAKAVLCGESFEIKGFKGSPMPGDEYDCWIWQGRHGKIWQTALERHVAAWRLPPSRQWSIDETSTSRLYDTLAQQRRWQLSYGSSGKIVGWLIQTPEGLLIANGGQSKIVAMLRAVLAHHLRMRRDLCSNEIEPSTLTMDKKQLRRKQA